MSGSQRSFRLPERLSRASEWIPEGSRLCDVGCDHAYLPIRLCLEGKIPSAIAMDLRSGPLDAARRNVREAGLDERIALRLSDGLQNYQAGESDTLVIAGMGGRLIARILEDAREKLSSFADLILGPQSEAPQLRRTLQELSCGIVQEMLVTDEGKRYLILHAQPNRNTDLTEEEMLFGPCLLRNRDPLLQEELLQKTTQICALIEKLEHETGPRAKERLGELEKEEQHLHAALQYYAM